MKKIKNNNFELIITFILSLISFVCMLYIKDYSLIFLIALFFFVLLSFFLFLSKEKENRQEKDKISICFYEYFSTLNNFTIEEIKTINLRKETKNFNLIFETFISSIKENDSIIPYLNFLSSLTSNESLIVKNIFLINKKDTKNKKDLVIITKSMLMNKQVIREKNQGFGMVFIILVIVLLITIFISKIIIR